MMLTKGENVNILNNDHFIMIFFKHCIIYNLYYTINMHILNHARVTLQIFSVSFGEK